MIFPESINTKDEIMKKVILVFGVLGVLSSSLKAQEGGYFAMEWGLLQVDGTLSENSNQGLFTYTKFTGDHFGFQGGVGMAGFDNRDFINFEASALYALANKRIWTFAGLGANDIALTPVPLAGIRINALRTQNLNVYTGYRHLFRQTSEGYFSLGVMVSLPSRNRSSTVASL